jgi:hypothetical protein
MRSSRVTPVPHPISPTRFTRRALAVRSHCDAWHDRGFAAARQCNCISGIAAVSIHPHFRPGSAIFGCYLVRRDPGNGTDSSRKPPATAALLATGA